MKSIEVAHASPCQESHCAAACEGRFRAEVSANVQRHRGQIQVEVPEALSGACHSGSGSSTGATAPLPHSHGALHSRGRGGPCSLGRGRHSRAKPPSTTILTGKEKRTACRAERCAWGMSGPAGAGSGGYRQITRDPSSLPRGGPVPRTARWHRPSLPPDNQPPAAPVQGRTTAQSCRPGCCATR